MQESTGKAALIRRDGSALLDRILDTPGIAAVVPRLAPDLLHRLIEQCGLESCGALMALATPAQVAQVLDRDLWRSPEAGVEERFDADRFGVWLEVLVDQGLDVAARTVAGMDPDLVAAGLAQHVRIFDVATLEGYVTTDGTEIPAVIERDGGLGCDIAGRRLIPRRQDAWDAIVDVLVELEASHPVAFGRLMRRCLALSNSRAEVDGLDALLNRGDQAMFDLADARGQRREAQGFASPAEAGAFLESSRRLRLDAGARPPAPWAQGTTPRGGPQHQAPVAVVDGAAPAAARTPADPRIDDDAASNDAVAAVVGLLVDGGLVARPPRGLLTAAPEPATRVRLIQAQMRAVYDRDPLVYAAREQELAWLANALMAGCRLDTRAFTAQEAADAVTATCNLGLESWPRAWRPGAALPDDFLVGQDLVTVFQVGWTVLHDDVCAHAAAAVLDVLAGLPAHDAETQAGLETLRHELRRHGRAGTPWHARDALDILATLDLPAWATLLALIAECPVALSTIETPGQPRPRTVDPSAFVFISERAQIAAVGAFLDRLPDMLQG